MLQRLHSITFNSFYFFLKNQSYSLTCLIEEKDNLPQKQEENYSQEQYLTSFSWKAEHGDTYHSVQERKRQKN